MVERFIDPAGYTHPDYFAFVQGANSGDPGAMGIRYQNDGTVTTGAYDAIALVQAFLLQAKDDPRSWVVILKDLLVAALTALLPWRK